MPFSANTFQVLIDRSLSQLRPKSFCDIGAGAGKYGKMIKEICERHDFECETTAIEMDLDYINTYELSKIYDSVLNINAISLLSLESPVKGDVCMLGDFIEHLPKTAGIDLLNYLIYRFNLIFLVIPIDLAQDGLDGHAQEQHISVWYPHDFDIFQNKSVITRTFEPFNLKFMLVVINGNQVDKKDLFFLYDNDDSVSCGFPYKNLEIVEDGYLEKVTDEVRHLLSNDFSKAFWNKRGGFKQTLSSVAELGKAPNVNDLIFTGRSELWCFIPFTTGKNYSPRILLKRNSTEGILDIVNPVHEARGFCQIDLSLLSDEWELIDENHLAVKRINNFQGFRKRCGIAFRYTGEGEISFSVAEISL
jgi:hypothetical protein